MDHPVDLEDSYADRRQLFKNIWDTAMQMDDKDTDIISKPKVIKTLRLDEVDRCAISKRKKLKLKNLRAICNKLLDFCDKQEADDLFYEQITANGQGPTHHNEDLKTNIVKKVCNKKKGKRTKSVFLSAKKSTPAKVTASKHKHEFITNFTTTTMRYTSPKKIRQPTMKKSSSKPVIPCKNREIVSNPPKSYKENN